MFVQSVADCVSIRSVAVRICVTAIEGIETLMLNEKSVQAEKLAFPFLFVYVCMCVCVCVCVDRPKGESLLIHPADGPKGHTNGSYSGH